MACISKDDDGETGQDRHDTLVGHDANLAFETHVVAFCKVIDDQDDKVTNRDQGNNASVFERIESAEERERNNNEPGHMSENNRDRVETGTCNAHMKAVTQKCLSSR